MLNFYEFHKLLIEGRYHTTLDRDSDYPKYCECGEKTDSEDYYDLESEPGIDNEDLEKLYGRCRDCMEEYLRQENKE